MTRLPDSWRTLLAVVAFTAIGAACTATPAGADPSASGRPAVSALPTSAPSTGDASTWPIASERLDQVLDLAAGETGQDRATLVIVSAEPVTWNDGSLGCPTPGSMYTQALVDGFRVVVAAGDRQLDYRMSATGDPRLCEHPGPAGSSGG